MGQLIVEWLLDNLISEPYSEEDFHHNSDMWDKAKEMEKQQIIDAYVECWKTHVPNGIEFKLPAKE
jgi:hypothetical protein